MLKVFYSKLEGWLSSNEFKKLKREETKQINPFRVFLNKFTLDYIREMDIDDYVLGKNSQSKGTFCYYVEYLLVGYGSIGGRTSAPQKYGIHWDEKQKKYSFGGKKVKRTRFGTEPKEIFQNIRKSLISLIEDTINNNQDGIIKNILNPQFKNKVSFLYSSNNQFPIYGDDDLNLILSVLNIPFSLNSDRFIKRKQLYSFYVDKGINKKMSPLLFMNFIYSNYGYHKLLRSSDKLLSEKTMIPIAKNLELIDVTLLEGPKTEEGANNKHKSNNGSMYNPDSEEKNRITGKKAERLVIEYLNTHKSELQIEGDIIAWCDMDDSKGYDISYKQSDGKEIYVEVKGVSTDEKDRIIFEISSNQRDTMKQNPDNYYIFFVNNVNNAKNIKRILAKDINQDNFKPIKFRVDVKAVQ